MREQVRDAVVRAHAPMSLLLWDRLTASTGAAFLALGVILAVAGGGTAAVVSLLGGAAILCASGHARRRHERAVWRLAAAEPDPVAALVLYEYLYRLRFTDVLDLMDWWDAGDGALPPACLPALHAHMENFPRER